jgi:flagellar biosynthesis protein FliP
LWERKISCWSGSLTKSSRPNSTLRFSGHTRRTSKTPPTITDANHPTDSLPMQVVIPAFVISELKTGFIFGSIIYTLFIIIDRVMSSLLMSMGRLMFPPTVISLTAKVLVFVLADGWHAIAGSLAASYY